MFWKRTVKTEVIFKMIEPTSEQQHFLNKKRLAMDKARIEVLKPVYNKAIEEKTTFLKNHHISIWNHLAELEANVIGLQIDIDAYQNEHIKNDDGK